MYSKMINEAVDWGFFRDEILEERKTDVDSYYSNDVFIEKTIVENYIDGVSDKIDKAYELLDEVAIDTIDDIKKAWDILDDLKKELDN